MRVGFSSHAPDAPDALDTENLKNIHVKGRRSTPRQSSGKILRLISREIFLVTRVDEHRFHGDRLEIARSLILGVFCLTPTLEDQRFALFVRLLP